MANRCTKMPPTTAQSLRGTREPGRKCGWKPGAEPSPCARLAPTKPRLCPTLPASHPSRPSLRIHRSRWSTNNRSANQNQLDIGDVGAGGSGFYQIAGCFKEMIGIVVSQERGCVQAQGLCARNSGAVGNGAG